MRSDLPVASQAAGSLGAIMLYLVLIAVVLVLVLVATGAVMSVEALAGLVGHRGTVRGVDRDAGPDPQ